MPTGGGLAAAYCYPSYIHADVGNVVGGMHCRHPFEIRRPESAVVPGERFSSSRLFGCERGSILSDSLTSAVSRFPFFFFDLFLPAYPRRHVITKDSNAILFTRARLSFFWLRYGRFLLKKDVCPWRIVLPFLQTWRSLLAF